MERNNLALLNASLNESFADEKNNGKKLQLKFTCPSATFAKHLWRHILSQQVFFTEEQAKFVKPKFSKPRIPLFSRGSTFRCPTVRVLHEIEHDVSAPVPRLNSHFERYSLQKQKARSEEEPWNNTIVAPPTPRSPKAKANSLNNNGQAENDGGNQTPSSNMVSSVVITNTTDIDGDLSRTTTTICTHPTVPDPQQAANCVVETSLDGINNGVCGGGSQLREELNRAVPLLEYQVNNAPSRVHDEGSHAGTEFRQQTFYQQQQHESPQMQNGSAKNQEEFHFTSTPAFNGNNFSMNGNGVVRKDQQVMASNRMSRVLTNRYVISISLCLFVSLIAILCYHWSPTIARYYHLAWNDRR